MNVNTQTSLRSHQYVCHRAMQVGYIGSHAPQPVKLTLLHIPWCSASLAAAGLGLACMAGLTSPYLLPGCWLLCHAQLLQYEANVFAVMATEPADNTAAATG